MPSPPRVRSPRPSASDRSPPARYQQQPGTVARDADGHLFLSGSPLNAIHELNPTGAAVWKLLDAPRSEAEIVDIFAAAFPDHDRALIERDVAAVLAALVDAGYLTVLR